MLRFLRLPRLFLAAAAALGFLAPLTASAAPPPSAVKAKSRPVLVSDSLSSSVAVKRASLFDRVRWVLIHPEPKRIINGRCVLTYQRILVPFPVR